MNTISKQFRDDIAESLFSRLDYIKCKPKNILILGETSEQVLKDVQKRYPKANFTVYADQCVILVKRTAWARMTTRARVTEQISGTIQEIPFQKNEFDVILSNLYFYQEPDLDKLYSKLADIIQPEGLLLFSTFGPDTPLPKYKLADMHDVGDAILKAGFKDPVMDAERIKQSNDVFEVVYGHAWGGAPKRQTIEEDGTVKISVNDLLSKIKK